MTVLAQALRNDDAEFLSLLGTASHASGAMAFFDGSRAEYRGLMHTGDLLGGWTLAAIGHDGVRLRSVSGEVELRVGQQLRRLATGQWAASEAERAASSVPLPPAPAPMASTVLVSKEPQFPVTQEIPDLPDKQLNKLEKKFTEPLKVEKMERKLEFEGGKEIKNAVKEMRRGD